MSDSTQRFSSRVDDSARYRPSYAPAAIELLRTRCGLSPEASVADVGSGTGILAEQLLAHGALVFAVEPNDKAGLQRVFETNSSLWGGLFNFIIPVFKQVPARYREKYFKTIPAKTMTAPASATKSQGCHESTS